MKAKNPKTGMKDILRIPIDEIDEIEHVEGTLQFYLHYQARVGASDSSASISGYLKRKIIKTNNTTGIQKEEKTELFESKFVKQFIETFNNVLELMDAQERELDEFIGEEAKTNSIPMKQSKPKVTERSRTSAEDMEGTSSNINIKSDLTSIAPDSKVLLCDNYIDQVNHNKNKNNEQQHKKTSSQNEPAIKPEEDGEHQLHEQYEYDEEYDEESDN